MKLVKNLLLCASIALLAACGSQESTFSDKNIPAAGVNIASAAPNNIANNTTNTPEKEQAASESKLLSSLATTYPNGQLPAERAAQAAQTASKPVAVGELHTCAIRSNGTVNCWGNNSYGQLGDGSTINRPNPAAVPSLAGVVGLAAGAFHTCALKKDGTVSCWGNNSNGQLGDGSTTRRPNPTAVPSLAGIVGLAAGDYHTCALKNDGTVSCWGDNSNGQLGDGSMMNRSSPTAVPSLAGVVGVKAGEHHTCALKNDDTASCWGYNVSGQLGDGTTTQRLSSTDVLGGPVFWK